MKSFKAILMLVAMLAISLNARADHDQVITFNQIPEAAQALLKQYFADRIPLVVTVDWDDYTIRGYEVRLNNGLEVEYDPTFQVIDIDD
jgi:hypothetical protein